MYEKRQPNTLYSIISDLSTVLKTLYKIPIKLPVENEMVMFPSWKYDNDFLQKQKQKIIEKRLIYSKDFFAVLHSTSSIRNFIFYFK